MRFLYGTVTVVTYEIEADDEATAARMLKDITAEKKRTVYTMDWGEAPDVPVAAVRNGVLGVFLNLMQNTIPGWEAPKIIHPFAPRGGRPEV